MRHTPGVAAKAMSIVAAAVDTIYLITTSEIDISFLSADESFSNAQDAIENTFEIQMEA